MLKLKSKRPKSTLDSKIEPNLDSNRSRPCFPQRFKSVINQFGLGT